MTMTSTLPELHGAFVDRLRGAIESDHRFQALLAGGSFVHGGFDEHSDLDFVIVVDEGAYEPVLADRLAFAERLGSLVNAFTGEHVGEPRLLICLYGPPFLHVDLKFVRVSALDHRVEEPEILFARDRAALARRLAETRPAWPNTTPEWFEARAWVWLHYAATKLARGELYEALGMLAFFREQVLGPMLHRRHGRPQRGVRRIETFGLDPDGLLQPTIATHDAASVDAAIRHAISTYLILRSDALPAQMSDVAPQALSELLDSVCRRRG
jgi:predicted nucleotidyltransferase